MNATLIVIGGKANKREVKIKLPARIGRGRDSDLMVAHPTVSRRHCELVEADGQIMVRDFGSLNGTLVDDEKITERILTAESRLTIGPITFKVVPAEADTVAAPVLAPEEDIAGTKPSPAAEKQPAEMKVADKAAPAKQAEPALSVNDSDVGLPVLEEVSSSAEIKSDSTEDLAFDWLELEEDETPANNAGANGVQVDQSPESIPLAQPAGQKQPAKAGASKSAASAGEAKPASKKGSDEDDELDSFFKELGID